MKKNAIFTLSGFILLLGLAACGKTTKGKLVNNWKITSSEEQWTSESETGHSSTTVIITETTYNRTYTHHPVGGVPGTVYETGTVNANDLKINKDGTWSSVREITRPLGNTLYKSKEEESGTWSFIEKTKGDDFKKNERVLFNVLAMKFYSVTKQNGATVSEHTSNTSYLTGERNRVYTITSSKKKKLEMEIETDNKYVSGSELSNKGLQKFVLEEK